jgi:hypothetical protein
MRNKILTICFMGYLLLGGPRIHQRTKLSPNHTMKTIRNKFVLLAIVIVGLTTAYAQDPLPSWNDGATER